MYIYMYIYISISIISNICHLFLGVPRLLQCFCNWLLLCNFMGQCERVSEPAVSVNSILPERKNSDPLNGRWLANSDGDFFSLWKSDQVVLTILQKLKQCCTPHLLIILFSNVLLLMLNFVLTFGFTESLFNFCGVVAANPFLHIYIYIYTYIKEACVWWYYCQV